MAISSPGKFYIQNVSKYFSSNVTVGSHIRWLCVFVGVFSDLFDIPIQFGETMKKLA